MARRTPAVLKPLLALGVPVAFGLVMEAALWLAGFSYVKPEQPMLIWNPVEDRAMEGAGSLHLIDPAQLWKPRPGGEVVWGREDGERVNPAGYRGPERPVEKAPGVLRVATMGDSSTFGMGVRYPECYSSQLEQILNRNGVKCEVLDFGVIGFTSRQGLERWDALVQRYRPDVVVSAFGAVNEHHACVSLPDDPKIRSSKERADSSAGSLRRMWKGSRLGQLVDYLAFRSAGGRKGLQERQTAQKKREHDLADTAGEVDWPGERRVPLEQFDDVLDALRRRIEDSGARMVVLSMPRNPRGEKMRPVLVEYSRVLLEFAREHGLQALDGRQLFRQVYEEQGLGPDDVFITGDFWHPNPRGHALLARALAPLVADPDRQQ